MREERVGAFLCKTKGGLGFAPQVCDAAGAHRETNKSRGRLEPEMTVIGENASKSDFYIEIKLFAGFDVRRVIGRER